MDNIKEQAYKDGYVRTLFYRIRYLPELSNNNYNIRSFSERAALNTPIQGTAADIIKIAMVKVYNRLKAENLKSKLILQVHDELIVEALLDEKDKVKAILQQEMENAVKFSVPPKANASDGKTWGEL